MSLVVKFNLSPGSTQLRAPVSVPTSVDQIDWFSRQAANAIQQFVSDEVPQILNHDKQPVSSDAFDDFQISGGGLTLKAQKFYDTLGYEPALVIEIGDDNLNRSNQLRCKITALVKHGTNDRVSEKDVVIDLSLNPDKPVNEEDVRHRKYFDESRNAAVFEFHPNNVTSLGYDKFLQMTETQFSEFILEFLSKGF